MHWKYCLFANVRYYVALCEWTCSPTALATVPGEQKNFLMREVKAVCPEMPRVNSVFRMHLRYWAWKLNVLADAEQRH
jgi:hypothetical protein